MLVDFRPVDLLDRMDWNDPDTAAVLRALGKLSIVVARRDATSARSYPMHVIQLNAVASQENKE